MHRMLCDIRHRVITVASKVETDCEPTAHQMHHDGGWRVRWVPSTPSIQPLLHSKIRSSYCYIRQERDSFVLARNMKLITVAQVAFLVVGSSKGFSPPDCRSKSIVRGYFGSELYATQEERDEALARYLEMADQETMETIQRVSLLL